MICTVGEVIPMPHAWNLCYRCYRLHPELLQHRRLCSDFLKNNKWRRNCQYWWSNCLYLTCVTPWINLMTSNQYLIKPNYVPYKDKAETGEKPLKISERSQSPPDICLSNTSDFTAAPSCFPSRRNVPRKRKDSWIHSWWIWAFQRALLTLPPHIPFSCPAQPNIYCGTELQLGACGMLWKIPKNGIVLLWITVHAK